MKKVGFIGAYDKTDLILSIAKVLVKAKKKVLVIDTTILQKAKYIVPTILPTVNYITSFDEIDVAVGFENIKQVKLYLGLEENDAIDCYDFIFLDVDTLEGAINFNLVNSDKIYYLTSFDGFSLRKGLELVRNLNVTLKMEKIFFSKEMLKEEEDYFDYLALDLKVEWEENKLYFLLENGDQSAQMENHLLQNVKLKNLSNEYKENIIFMTNTICNEVGERTIRKIVKEI